MNTKKVVETLTVDQAVNRFRRALEPNRGYYVCWAETCIPERWPEKETGCGQDLARDVVYNEHITFSANKHNMYRQDRSMD